MQESIAPRFTGIPKKWPLLLGVEAWGKARGQSTFRVTATVCEMPVEVTVTGMV
jgi:hypothetical protein